MGRKGWTGGMGWMGSAVLLLGTRLFAAQPPGQNEFVPIKELPPAEQMPAAPLLITAYVVFLVLVVFYVWTVWRRLNQVDADLHALEQRLAKK